MTSLPFNKTVCIPTYADDKTEAELSIVRTKLIQVVDKYISKYDIELRIIKK